MTSPTPAAPRATVDRAWAADAARRVYESVAPAVAVVESFQAAAEPWAAASERRRAPFGEVGYLRWAALCLCDSEADCDRLLAWLDSRAHLMLHQVVTAALVKVLSDQRQTWQQFTATAAIEAEAAEAAARLPDTACLRVRGLVSAPCAPPRPLGAHCTSQTVRRAGGWALAA